MWGHRTDNWTKLLAIEVQTSNDGGRSSTSTAKITKEIGSGSQELLRAYENAELFDEIVIEVTGRSQSVTGEVVVSRITLTNAMINSVWRYASVVPTTTGKLVEDYGLLFQRYDRQEVL